MTPRLPARSAKDIIAVLKRHGFTQVRQSGSHAIFRHSNGRRVTVPVHANRDLGRGHESR